MTWDEEQLAMLRPNYPQWGIWTVRVLYPKPGYVWCARPKGHPIATVNAESPEALVAAIAERERPEDAR
jgi:hypothetical protein